jgi:hypothetical protein
MTDDPQPTRLGNRHIEQLRVRILRLLEREGAMEAGQLAALLSERIEDVTEAADSDPVTFRRASHLRDADHLRTSRRVIRVGHLSRKGIPTECWP